MIRKISNEKEINTKSQTKGVPATDQTKFNGNMQTKANLY